MFKTYQAYSRAATITMAAIFVSIILCGCYSSKKALADTDKAILKFPAAVLTHLREQFPCTVLPTTDTITTLRDTTIFIDCPEQPDSTIITEVIRDTVNRTVTNTRTIRVPVKMPVQVQTITRYIRDSAESVIIREREREVAQLKIDLATNKGKKNMWFWIAMGLLALHAVWIFGKLKTIGIPKLTK